MVQINENGERAAPMAIPGQLPPQPMQQMGFMGAPMSGTAPVPSALAFDNAYHAMVQPELQRGPMGGKGNAPALGPSAVPAAASSSAHSQPLPAKMQPGSGRPVSSKPMVSSGSHSGTNPGSSGNNVPDGSSTLANSAVLDMAADVMDEIENCKLIEKPTTTTVNVDLTHDIKDCPGYCPELPLVRPNCSVREPTSIVDAAIAQCGDNRSVAKPDRCWGTPFLEGKLPLYEHNGKVKLSNTGRYRLKVLSRSSWVRSQNNYANQNADNNGVLCLDLNKEVFVYKTLLYVRVPVGKYAFVTDNGIQKILDEGAHIFNKGTTTFQEFQDSSQFYMSNGGVHIIRVPRGRYAKVWVQLPNGTLVPRLLAQGIHCIVNNFFQFDGLVSVSEEVISHGAINVLSIAKGKVAKVFHNNRPRLFGEGLHVIESTNFEYCGMMSMMDKIIGHGTITILRVPLGELGVCWLKNQPLFIDHAGLYAFDTPDFSFVKHVPLSEKIVTLGAKKIVMVYTGEVGISYDHGELRILDHGRHMIDASTHLFEGFISTQQKSVRLVTETSEERVAKKIFNEKRKEMEKKGIATNFDMGDVSGIFNGSSSSLKKTSAEHMNDDLLQCETKDLVKVGVRADVFYSIPDPLKAISSIRADEIEDLVRETAIATLTNIIRSTALNEIAQSKLPSAISETSHKKSQEEQMVEQALGGPSAPLFFDKAHDEFLSKLHDDFLTRYGLDIANIRIESFKIMDDELAESISKQALVTAQTENQLANLKGQTEIATAEQRRTAEVQNIKATAEAQSLKVQNDAANSRRIEAAKAAAESERLKVQIEAEAAANAAITKAKAEAESIRLVSEAESKRAHQLSETALGQQQALLQVYADMVKESNQGIEKIVYMDPTLAQNGSAFSMAALSNLNRDLQMLNTVGHSAETGVQLNSPASTKAPSTPPVPSTSSKTGRA
jgi:regulator of protease activity HflC (stomatin/prohibitin superfamily)